MASNKKEQMKTQDKIHTLRQLVIGDRSYWLLESPEFKGTEIFQELAHVPARFFESLNIIPQGQER